MRHDHVAKTISAVPSISVMRLKMKRLWRPVLGMVVITHHAYPRYGVHWSATLWGPMAFEVKGILFCMCDFFVFDHELLLLFISSRAIIFELFSNFEHLSNISLFISRFLSCQLSITLPSN